MWKEAKWLRELMAAHRLSEDGWALQVLSVGGLSQKGQSRETEAANNEACLARC